MSDTTPTTQGKLTYVVEDEPARLAGIFREDGSVVALGHADLDGGDMRRMVHAANCHADLLRVLEIEQEWAAIDDGLDDVGDAVAAFKRKYGIKGYWCDWIAEQRSAALARARGEVRP